jgi:6-phosphogluconate dehydrogenase (decarboxylating)
MPVSWAPRKETQILCQETKTGLKQTQSQNTHKAFYITGRETNKDNVRYRSREERKVDKKICKQSEADLEKGKGGTNMGLMREFAISFLVKAGSPVDQTIAALSSHIDPGNAIIDSGNEWYENTKR